MKPFGTPLAFCLALAAASPALADLNATVYADWQRDGVLHGGSGDITFQGLTTIGSFVDANINHWNDSIYYRWNPFGRDELYSVKWTGFLDASTAGTYQFRATSDDGIQVLLGGSKVIDAPVLQWYQASTGSTSLSKGLIPIEVRFYENYTYDGLRLEWMRPGDTAWSVIPASSLSPVPEPATVCLTVAGLAALAARRRSARTGSKPD